MNLGSHEPMKQQIHEIQKGIKQCIAFKPDKPNDLFQFYHPQIRKQFTDAYNLCRIWIQNFLYWKNIYPKQAFQVKTAYCKKVQVVRSKMLRQYLDKLFQNICQNLEHISFVQIKIYQYGQMNEKVLIQSQRLYLNFSQKFFNCQNVQQIKKKGVNTIQKQMQFKRFVAEMQQLFSKGYKCPSNKKSTFELHMGYKWDHKSMNNRHRQNLLQNWTQVRQPQQSERQTVNYAGTGQLQILCQRSIPRKQQKIYNQ